MTEPHWSEDERLAALRKYDILDTPAEPEFDDAVALVRTICGTPIALVSLVDDCRQWFKAKAGVDAEQTDLDTSVCALAIRQDELFVIEDLSSDPRTAHMSLVTGDPEIRFYAGMPLTTSQGFSLGSLCAIDIEPRPEGLNDEQEQALKALARQVVAQIEMRGAISTRDRTIVTQERRQAQAARDSAVLRTMLRAQQEVLNVGGDFDASLQALVDAALNAVEPADGVVVAVRDGECLVYRATNFGSLEEVGTTLSIADSFSGRCLTEEVTLVTANAADDDRVDREMAARLNIGSMVVVPLTRHGEPFGVLKLRSAQRDAFRSRDILICQMLAGLISTSFTESAEIAALRSVTEASESYRHIVDSAIDSAIISTDEDGLITSWSKGAETIMGWAEEEVLGKHLGVIFTPEDLASNRPTRELERAARDGRASDERWHIRKDGSLFYAHGAVTPLLGSGKGYVKSLRDVTEEHATRTELDASRLQLDTALETGLIGFFNWDIQNDRVRGDSRFAEFYGLDADRLAEGMPMRAAFGRIFPADLPALEAELPKIFASCVDYSHSYRVLRDDGGTRWMLVRGRCVEQENGRPLRYVGTSVDVTEQREAEEHLQLSRERLELATRAAELGSFDYLPQQDLLHWDNRCRALFGISPGAPISYEGSYLAGLHPEDRDRADAAVRKALDPAGSGRFDINYRTIGIKDGKERFILAKGLAVFAEGVPIRLLGTVQDVTADHRSRALLAETEERFRLAIRATNDAIWDWDLRRDHVQWNDALERSYGHGLSSVAPVGAWWLDHIHADDRERVSNSIHAVINGADSDWADEYRFQRADGSYADVRDRGYVIRDSDGNAIRMLGALLDQTDRKTIERNLQALNATLEIDVNERTEELNRLWESSPDLLVVLDFEGAVQRVNPAWSTVLGYSPEELLGHYINDFVCPDDVSITEQALADAAGGPLPTVENRYFHKDGSIRWMSWVAAPTEHAIYATGRHVTAEKEAEAALRAAEDQLRQAQKVEAIGQLTGGVAHDFNNLLTVIRGSADLLARDNVSDEKRKRYVEAIAVTADRATKLTSQLLAFARRSSLKPEVFDAGSAVRGLHDMMGTLTGSMIDVAIDLPEEALFIKADRSQFETAMVNMAVNARDAMDRQGRINIAVRVVDTIPASRVHEKLIGEFVAVSIADEGSGIAPDKIDQIFEPFFTSKAVGEGTGLGLSQVFGFAKQSGGEVLVASKLGEGSTFTLYLPRADASKHDVSATRDAGPVATTGACILVVEDNADVGTFATTALAELGHFTVLASGAEEALAKLSAGASSFDAIFSDVVMPGMNGVDFAREVARLYPGIPILLTSGYSSVLAEEGAHGFSLLHKPYSVTDLSRALQLVILNKDGGQ
ncbi:MAG: PAS domain S-box protein [Sphingobium sp.]|uniref:PAS domain S-box protein n=1 Tax=Sphingobium sp. TaxID=1912891 RepID=UPI0029A2D832|nr:PAS domain S-box protein [Sphingobium sp.]MDX3910149.1 PAS domain S-box protein [Sphingobium sp.]